jgi:hypothetical protein
VLRSSAERSMKSELLARILALRLFVSAA